MERQAPTAEHKHGSPNVTLSHPAFGQVVACRVNGGRMNLYGTDFIPDGFITLTVSHSQLERSLSRDWHFPKKEIIEIAMSEAQWATLISSLNIGGGVPCTLQHLKMERIPQIENPTPQRKKFSDEMKKNFLEAKQSIRDLVEKIQGMNLPKGKSADIITSLNSVRMKIDGNAKFVADSFDEHIETKIEEAKMEAHGYLARAVSQAGISALSGADQQQKAIEDASDV